MPSPSVPATTRAGLPIEVRRSARRKRTVNAVFRDGVAVVSIPAHFTRTQEAEWVQRMVDRLESRAAAPAPDRSEERRVGKECPV